MAASAATLLPRRDIYRNAQQAAAAVVGELDPAIWTAAIRERFFPPEPRDYYADIVKRILNPSGTAQVICTADQLPLVVNGQTVACLPRDAPEVGGAVGAIGAREEPGYADVWRESRLREIEAQRQAAALRAAQAREQAERAAQEAQSLQKEILSREGGLLNIPSTLPDLRPAQTEPEHRTATGQASAAPAAKPEAPTDGSGLFVPVLLLAPTGGGGGPTLILTVQGPSAPQEALSAADAAGPGYVPLMLMLPLKASDASAIVV